jgi:glycosyltransferase involved in cell wall biosynthesis
MSLRDASVIDASGWVKRGDRAPSLASRMLVTFDDQVFTLQKRGGISRYFTELLRVFRADPGLGVEPSTPFRYVVNEHIMELDPSRYRRLPAPQVVQRDRVLRPLNRLMSRHVAGATILHHTYYLPDGLEVPAAKRICTIYDMTPELFPDMFPQGNPHRDKERYVRACDAIACISNTSKADLLKIYGDLDKPVVVTPLGVTGQFFDPPARTGNQAEFVLYVGQRVGYKNFDVLLRALTHLLTARPSLQLICVGPAFTNDETARLAELGLADRVSRRSADDGELVRLFAAADCFVFPSLYEGFGLPIIEAFAAGCPVLLADTPCSVEVGGEAAQFFAPDDDQQLAGMIDRLVGDTQSRTAWIEAGRLRARDFTWERTAKLTGDMYRNLVAVA